MYCKDCNGWVRESDSWNENEEGYEDFWCTKCQEYRKAHECYTKCELG